MRVNFRHRDLLKLFVHTMVQTSRGIRSCFKTTYHAPVVTLYMGNLDRNSSCITTGQTRVVRVVGCEPGPAREVANLYHDLVGFKSRPAQAAIMTIIMGCGSLFTSGGRNRVLSE